MMQTFAVTVPPGIGPGQQFQASLDGQLTMVIVPHGSGPNSTLHVQIPVRPSTVQKYAVTIPNNVQPGGRFQANLGGQLVWLTCPRNLGPGKQMLVDANSANAANGGQAKSWPPPIAVPDSLDGKPPFLPPFICTCSAFALPHSERRWSPAPEQYRPASSPSCPHLGRTPPPAICERSSQPPFATPAARRMRHVRTCKVEMTGVRLFCFSASQTRKSRNISCARSPDASCASPQ